MMCWARECPHASSEHFSEPDDTCSKSPRCCWTGSTWWESSRVAPWSVSSRKLCRSLVLKPKQRPSGVSLFSIVVVVVATTTTTIIIVIASLGLSSDVFRTMSHGWHHHFGCPLLHFLISFLFPLTKYFCLNQDWVEKRHFRGRSYRPWFICYCYYYRKNASVTVLSFILYSIESVS